MFEALVPGEKKNRLILWPRGHFKTSAVVIRIVQDILNEPDCRLLIMQGNLKLTKGWLHEIRSHFNGKNPKSRLLELFPDFKIVSGDAFHFTVGARKRVQLKEATVTAASPKAISTGQHYGGMYADDLVHALNFRNVEMLDKLDSEFNHFLPLIDPGGYITVTGTRYSFADLYQRIQSRNKGEWVVSIRKCYKADGSLLFPERLLPDGRKIGFTAELLAQLRRDDPEMFSPQYLNEVLLGKDQIFPKDLLLGAVKATRDPEFPAYGQPIFMIDLAESEKATADHSVLVVAKPDNRGRIWIVDVVGGTFSPSQFVTIILQQAVLHRPSRIWLDNQPGSKVYQEYLNVRAAQVSLRVAVDIVKSERQKDAKYIRIAALESQFKQRRLFLCAGIHDFERLEEEFTQFPRGRHDDRPDAIALAVNQLNQSGFCRAPLKPLPDPHSWMVQAVLDDAVEVKPSSSLCGEGFV